MSALDQHLHRLLQWLDEVHLPPPSRNLRIIELSGARADESALKTRISRSEIRTPTEYEARFDQLLAAGYPWLNLSCLGLFGDFMLVGVELPGPRDLYPGRFTTIDLSGPAGAVLARNWNVDAVWIVE